MEANGLLDGTSEEIPGHSVLDGTALEIAYNLRGDDLILRVNKGGVLVFRAMLAVVATEMGERQLMSFDSFAPDMVFRLGDSQEGLQRMLSSAGMAEAVTPQKRRHEKGDGFNVILQALPLHGNGKLVMRAHEPEAAGAPGEAGVSER
jgi:hypothetical protein